ncbi:MAG: hypothetical protein Q9168_007228 [Polycauliona sp. 1 TL-2023]
MQLSYLISLLLALPCHSILILLPLYLYPDEKASAWSAINNTIAAKPDVDWQIIVNPESGPGSYPPDSNYITALALLNSYPNVLTLGYVATGYTKTAYQTSRAIGESSAYIPECLPAHKTLTSQIDTYAKWATYTKADIAVGGIFFDETNNTAANEVYSYYKKAGDYAHSKIASAQVVLNPGAPAPVELFDYAETVVQFEDPYSKYKDLATIKNLPKGTKPKTAIIVHSTPSNADVGPLVKNMVAQGIEAVYFGADCCYNSFDGTLLSEVADGVLGEA